MDCKIFSDLLTGSAAALLADCREKKIMLTTAESCTGGLIASCLTEINGSSDVVDSGFVTYSYSAKNALLKVPMSLIEKHGAVSPQVACAMAEGAIMQTVADISVAVTGVAGPGGGTNEKPVGLVHMACSERNGLTIHQELRLGNLGRANVRMATVQAALQMLASAVLERQSDP